MSNLKANCADFLNFGLQTFFQVLNTSDLMQVKITSKSSFVIFIWSVKRIHQLTDVTLWKFVAENHTENFATLKITLKNNIKEGFTENYTEKRPLLFRNAKNG